MFTHPRESWQRPSQPVSGPAFPGWARYTDVAIHYTSAAKIPADIDAYHRAMQNDYLTSRGFSLGYTCSVDQQRGESREIRGLDFKPAATRNSNDFAMAILILVDGEDMATPAACAEVRRIIGHWETLAGRELRIKGHGEYVPTGCPGSGLRAQIALGEFSPRWNPAPPSPPPVVPPITPEPVRRRMLVCVGNDDNRSDPRRWVYNGLECRLLVNEADYNEISLFWGWVGSSITAPHWKPLTWIQALGG
jgi:hypothetical protein